MAFCTSCGVARAQESDRFCRSCGQPHDPVDPSDLALPATGPVAGPSGPAAGPAHPAPTPPPYSPAGPGSPAASGLLPPVPLAEPASHRPRGRMLVAVLGTVVALGVGGLVTWQFLVPGGGAGSPEEAARSMIEAGATQDPLVLVDLIAPAEVSGLEDLVEDARERAEEEGLVGEDRITDALDISVSDLEFEVDELGDDLARVTLVGGEYEVSWDPDKLPERLSFLRDASESDSDSGDLDDLIGEGDEPYVITIKDGGRWYVTAVGTFAEYSYQAAVQEEEDVDRADYDLVGEDLEPVVGKDPEDVIARLFETISEGDTEELLASLPDELGLPLRPYASIVEDALSGRYSEGNRLSLELTADGLDLETEDLGDDLVRVTIEGGTFTGTASEEGQDSDTATIEVDGRCLTGTGADFADYDYTDGYYDEYGNYVEGEDVLVSESQTWCLGGEDEAARVLDDLGIDAYFVVLRKVDDGYQLDPIATAAEYGALALESLDGRIVEDLLDIWEDGL